MLKVTTHTFTVSRGMSKFQISIKDVKILVKTCHFKLF
jgi:hypothetical protein